MKKIKLTAICTVLCVTAALLGTACGELEEVNINEVGAAGVVPAKAELIENLSGSGYEISEYDDIYGLDADGERVYAEKGRKYIDICYGLGADEAEDVFGEFEDRYENENYYILAKNERFVYCVSDKQTFKKSGFKSTANNGVQYIRE